MAFQAINRSCNSVVSGFVVLRVRAGRLLEFDDLKPCMCVDDCLIGIQVGYTVLCQGAFARLAKSFYVRLNIRDKGTSILYDDYSTVSARAEKLFVDGSFILSQKYASMVQGCTYQVTILSTTIEAVLYNCFRLDCSQFI
jgi:hypothetical protein